ncbi:MAG: T9SS type A sorting domain-containing protein [Bacteroidota bacterium]
MKLYAFLAFLTAVHVNPAFAQLNFWKQLNGPYGGDIRSMTAGDSGQIYVWTNSFNGLGDGKLSYSSDAGKNWEHKQTPGRFVLQLLRTSKKQLVVVTNESFFRLDSGKTEWINIANSLPLDPQRVSRLAEANRILFVVMYNYGLYASSNDGISWNLLNASDTAYSFTHIVADTTGTLFAGGRLGVFTSVDSGKSWISKNAGLEQTNFIVETMTTDKNGTLYVSFNMGGFFVSTDQGNTWKKHGTMGHFEGFIISSFGGKYFAGYGGKIIFSADSGTTWNFVAGKNLGNNIRKIALDSGGILYGATARGTVYSSTDDGETWFTSGLANKYISNITVGSNGTIYAGAIDYGLSMSKDKGDHWQAIDVGLPSPINLHSLLTVSDQYLFAGTETGLYRTKLDTIQWKLAGCGLQAYAVTATAKLNDSILFAGFKHGVLYRSLDGGNTWKIITTLSKAIFDIVPGKDGKIFASGPGGVYKSTNNGDTWSTINMAALLEGGYVEALAVSPNKTIFASSIDALLRSTDDGVTWTRILGTNGHLHPIDALIVTNTGTIYTAWDSAYVSTDNGNTWESTNIYSPDCFSLSSDGFLYAGNWYGVFSTQPKVMNVNPSDLGVSATTFSLSQNYPNPFNPTTSIHFTVPHNSFVTLTIYDLMGREIEQLVAEERRAGTYTIKFIPKNLSSGMYFYRLQSGSFSDTKKLILVK